MNSDVEKVVSETTSIVRREVKAGRISERECNDIGYAFLKLAVKANRLREKHNETQKLNTVPM